MRRLRGALAVAVFFALAACGADGPRAPQADQPHPRQQPSTLTPGLHVSGQVSVGIARSF